MEIKDPVHGSIELTPPEVVILDSPSFQRLRAIRQLGFGEYSFPGATHNRYIHSLGVCHLSGLAFDSVFSKYQFEFEATKLRLKQTLRLAALLHDIGHGPLSHTSEEGMPDLSTLKLEIARAHEVSEDRQANHEDYTLKFITTSPLSETIKKQFHDIDPIHIACLIDKTITCPDDFFIDRGVNLRTILSQIISSEMDVDRMDYLGRDSYFCGTNYGKVELTWLLANLTYHRVGDQLQLALDRKALYTFDDFITSRHHMYLMVYFHHKCIIFDEMLYKYMISEECDYHIPADTDEYLRFTDNHLYEHLRNSENEWARRISNRRPYRVLFELHQTGESTRPHKMKQALGNAGIEVIHSSSIARLSKYHTASASEKALQIFVVDQYDRKDQPYPLEEATEIFQRYEKSRRIERLYVAPENYDQAQLIIEDHLL